MPRKFFGDRSQSEAIEGAKNARYTHAKTLYRHILDDLNPQHFTLQDIKDSFNPKVKFASAKTEGGGRAY